MTEPRAKPILIAAGGTGGHTFPAEALARELLRREQDVTLITDRRGDRLGIAIEGVDCHRIHAGGVMSGSAMKRMKGLVNLAIGTLQAERLLRRIRPAAAVGFGGYPSLPTILAATRHHVPSAIHEQNAVLGRANRFLAPRVAHIATSFEKVSGIRQPDRMKICPTGNPIRAEIAALATRGYPAVTTNGSRNLLVLGGSQGAHVFAEVVPAALGRLPEAVRRRLRVRQQCRAEDCERVRSAYVGLGITADIATFFDDVPERLGAAHLVISRAGASTVAELSAAGRPAILVPYPHATDDHQTANAKAIADIGGAWLVPEPNFTAEALESRLLEILDRPVMLGTAALCARAHGQRDAACRLAELTISMALAGTTTARNPGTPTISTEAMA